MELVFASNNQHKLDEIRAVAGDAFTLKSLNDIGCTADIPETGNTFAANAGQKSWFIYDRFKLNCFADDSGLEVDALDGEPGVDSAHYAGTRESDKNIALVLEKLGTKEQRTARFKTVISLILDGQEYLFEGSVEGEIINGLSGTAGFGYDPIFRPLGSEKTFAEMTAAEKNSMSHRARALSEMIRFLKTRG